MTELLKIKLTKEELDRAEAACIRAGYSPKNARRTASRFLRTPHIREIIDKVEETEEEERGKKTSRRTRAQIHRMLKVLLDGGTKTEAMIAGGYSPKSAQSNTNKVLPRTNQRHERFAWGLHLFGWNKTRAAIWAGYKPKWAGTNTARLMKYPDVQLELRRIALGVYSIPSRARDHSTDSYGF